MSGMFSVRTASRPLDPPVILWCRLDTVSTMGTVPEHLRLAVAAELDQLVQGDRPDMMLWVLRYRPRGEPDRGATLIDQPDEVFDHRYIGVIEINDGGWALDLPLWTTEEALSDLTVSMAVSADRAVTIDDLRVQ